MSNMTIVAIYDNQELAEIVIDELVDKNHKRENIGLAVNQNSDEALLAVTVNTDDLDDTTFMMKQHNPNTMVTRQTGWRQGDEFKELHPNAEDFTAVARKEKK